MTTEELQALIDKWIELYIKQTIGFRSGQKVTPERINELFNLLITQGDENARAIALLRDYNRQFKLEFNGQYQEMLDRIAEAISISNANMEQMQLELDTTTTSLNNRLTTVTTDLNNRLDTTTTNLNSRLTTTTNDLNDRLDTTTANLNSNLTTVTNDLNNKLDTNIASLTTLVNNAIAENKGYVDTNVQDALNAVQELSTIVEGYRLDVINEVAGMTQEVAQYKQDIEDTIGAAADVIEEAGNLAGMLEQLETDIETTSERTTVLETDLNNLEDSLASHVTNAEIAKTAGGTATAITIANGELVHGKVYTLLPTSSSADGVAKTINGKGFYKVGTTTSPALVAGKPIAIWYNATTSAFYVIDSLNAGTVNNKTVESNVPASAKFTDTVYTHPTTSGNKHIPSGGASGQVLKWSSDGTASWGTDNDTVYTHPTTTGNKHIPSGGSSGQVLKWSSDGTASWGTDNDTVYTHPTTHPTTILAAGSLPIGVLATNSTDYTTSRLRNARFGTEAPTSLANGEIFLVYE